MILRLIGFREELPIDWHPNSPENARTSPPEDVEVSLALRNTVARNSWRLRAGLPQRQDERAVRLWHTFLDLRAWQAKFRRRHPHNPMPPRAA